MKLTHVTGTDLFIGTAASPWQVVRVGVDADVSEVGSEVTVTGEGLQTAVTGTVTTGGAGVVEVGVDVGDARPGTVLPVAARCGAELLEGTVVVEEPGWTMHMVSHFHYDPVWWNTQAAYTSEWDDLDFSGSPRADFQQAGFTLVQAHLEMARQDPDYCFVLAEVDYLKPYWDRFPEDREELRRLLAEERLELMGGTWNEPNTNLTGAEVTVRNAVYGSGFQRTVLGGDPQTAWQLDVFGHDPQFPGLMADAGLSSSSWARGPFHQWGPMMDTWDSPLRDARVMQFPAEFEWLSPSGRGLLTSYMPAHYGAGWRMDSAASLEQAMEAAYEVYAALKPVSATRNVLLPVGTDYTPPNRWVTRVHREWAARYVWPRFVCSLPRHYFAAVRAELGDDPGSPQSRDMNPIYTGKDVSYIDTKQAQRETEVLIEGAEKWSTIAASMGARYPEDLLDKAWRQLVYGAHHDAITGSESDQVYLDLLAGWREAHDLAGRARDSATAFLAGLVDLGRTDAWGLTVFNALSWERTDIARVRVDLGPLGAPGLRVRTLDGLEVPFVLEAGSTGGGPLGEAVLVFLADQVPSVGHRTWLLTPAADLPPGARWEEGEGTTARNAAYEVTADPARGGALNHVRERRTGRDLLTPGGLANDLVVHEEYPDHPDFKEGPWHLVPRGSSQAMSDRPAESVVLERSAVGERLVTRAAVGPAASTQQVTLWHGVDRVDFTTTVDRWTGSDQLLRVRFPLAVPGALPVSETANAVIGRGFGFPDVDTAEHPWTLDNPCNTWFGLSSTVQVCIRDGAHEAVRAIGIADVVAPRPETASALARELVVALVARGVTATTSTANGPRYGLLEVDSNLPDVRVALGGPDTNAFTAAVLQQADEEYAAELRAQLDRSGRARLFVPASQPLHEVWVPGADLREPGALPVLIVAGSSEADLRAEVDSLVTDLDDARVEVTQPTSLHPDDAFEDRTVALLNRGMPGFVVDTDGTLHLSLMRSCTGWPSGVWIDPPARTVPDGSSFQLQHWTHRFEYALVSGDGDWRAVDVVRSGHGYNHRLDGVLHRGGGQGRPDHSYVRVEPAHVAVSVVKRTGNPLAQGRLEPDRPTSSTTFRLYETQGRATEATLMGWQPVSTAQRADLHEQPGSALAVEDDGVRVPLGASDIATVVCEVAAPTTSTSRNDEAPARPLDPDHARYWLHNRGVGPTGAHPVAPHLHTTEDPSRLRLTVASGLTRDRAAGTVALRGPEGWVLEPSDVPYDLGPGEYLAVDVLASPPASGSGTHLLCAVLTDPDGWKVEDVQPVRLGADAGPVLEASITATGPLHVEAGAQQEVVVSLRSKTHGTLHAEVQLLTPWGTWEGLPDWTARVEVEDDGKAEHTFSVRAAAGAPAGQFWLMAKVMGAGEVVYTEPLLLTVGDPAGGVS